LLLEPRLGSLIIADAILQIWQCVKVYFLIKTTPNII